MVVRAAWSWPSLALPGRRTAAQWTRHIRVDTREVMRIHTACVAGQRPLCVGLSFTLIIMVVTAPFDHRSDWPVPCQEVERRLVARSRTHAGSILKLAAGRRRRQLGAPLPDQRPRGSPPEDLYIRTRRLAAHGGGVKRPGGPQRLGGTALPCSCFAPSASSTPVSLQRPRSTLSGPVLDCAHI